ncbi:MAG: hypothetical protein RBG13Loki_2997 [Promethearchaeota archaeon CR_4]|nr:MAG: hypothetical protein RBG13Loki_2997 [Candidatus Lokiarchaeota archaeon CR_4]
MSIYVTANGLSTVRAASDAGVLKVIDTAPRIQLLGDMDAPDNGTYGIVANANETVSYIVKNVGNETVNLSSVSLNGTVFAMNEGTFYKYQANGTRYNSSADLSLDIQEVGTFVVDVSTRNIRLNESTICQLGVATSGTSVASNITVRAEVNPSIALEIIDDEPWFTNCTASSGNIFVSVSNLGKNLNVTLNALIVNGTSFDILANNVTAPVTGTLSIAPETRATFRINISSIGLVAGQKLRLVVICKEGRRTAEYDITILS